jgi:hypothetical protein
MPQEFVARNGIVAQNNSIVSGSLTISGSVIVTGSIISTVTPLVSGSSQIVYSGLTGIPSGIISGSAQLPSGIVSGSVQIVNLGFATTSSVITASSVRKVDTFTATTNQSTFTASQGYSVGLIDVYVNGSKLAAADYVATNGTTVVLNVAAEGGETVELYAYFQALNSNNALRTVTTRTATASQTLFTGITYTQGLIEVYYNGSRLSESEYTATNGTSVTLSTAANVNDILDFIAYNYTVGAFVGLSGTGTANYLPKYASTSSLTNSSIIDNSGTVTINGSLNVTGSINGTSLSSFKQTGSLTNAVIISDPTQVAQSPIPKYLWHDMIAFGRFSPVFQTSTDGVSYSASTLNNELFAQKENQSIQVANGTSVVSARWIWTGVAWIGPNAHGLWLVIGHTYQVSSASKTVVFETSSDNVNWTVRHTSSNSFNIESPWSHVTNFGGDNYARLTITTSNSQSINLSCIKLLSSRWGNQGLGSEIEFPYNWDGNKNITASAKLSITTVSNSTGDFLTINGSTGEVQKRTAAQVYSDIGVSVSTGSNTFNGNQTINGNLVVTGSLTAQQFIVSSSVTYMTTSFASGSHKFGDSSDDTHQFTGSVLISGSIGTTGNVGVGGASSGTYGKLSVLGGISIKDDNNAKLEIGRYSSGSPNSYIKLGTNSNSLRFTNAGDLADIMELTNSGSLGLGVTPSAWYTGGGYKVLQIGAGMSFDSGNDFRARMASNAYVNTSGDWVYLNTSFATNYIQTSGQHIWQTAPSGTSGNTISFTTAMTLDSTGRLGIGVTPTQKLEVSGNIKSTGTMVMSSPFAFRNKIQNGDMRIDQRYNGAGISNTDGAFVLDRFRAWNAFGGAASWNFSRSTVAPPGFSNSLSVTSTTGVAIQSGNYAGIRHQIEGLNTYDLAWGTASAKNITVSFWVRSSVTGTYGFTIRNGNTNNYGYVSAYTISSANTWTYITLNIPGPTSGTWATDYLPSLNCIWDLGAGTSYSYAAGSWINASEILGLTGGVKFFTNSSATYYLTGVQLEVGDVATPFETKPYSTELSLCQRYFRMIANGNDQVVLGGWSFNSTTQMETDYMSPVQMRDAPTLEQTATMYRINSAGLNNNFTSTVGTIISGINGGRLSYNLTGGVAGQGVLMRVYQNGGYIGLSAEI